MNRNEQIFNRRGYVCHCGASFKYHWLRTVHQVTCNRVKGWNDHEFRCVPGWRVAWYKLKCFLGFHENIPVYGIWPEGYGTRHGCWWCNKEKEPFKRDEEAYGNVSASADLGADRGEKGKE